ncbi:phospholipase D-like domain-containing protein DpdK [Bacillus sp. X1(2014)]|uniref:phospholipase D-like domain-containing protein DpdK n=1 Tax=Bacillus sp. X1(2014) TaxID=1565991 RepID=UPI0011A7E488|nr:phospholipase D-like domain-containing protein DpdK [Bacillus sp. X1(2014)]
MKTNYPSRFIHTTNYSQEIADVLQSLFVMEIIQPSRCLWIVSPWISDIPIIYNEANQFLTIEPHWSRKKVTFSEVLVKLVENGTVIRLATRPDPHNNRFLEKLKAATKEYEDRVHIYSSYLLHSKGLLGDQFYLNGSMNFTFNGITVNEESVQLITDPQDISQNRIEFANRWGDEHLG